MRRLAILIGGALLVALGAADQAHAQLHVSAVTLQRAQRRAVPSGGVQRFSVTVPAFRITGRRLVSLCG